MLRDIFSRPHARIGRHVRACDMLTDVVAGYQYRYASGEQAGVWGQ
jgi:hypothetical protein